jgi:transcriptional regulator of acetoin/glycerol metabolism
MSTQEHDGDSLTPISDDQLREYLLSRKVAEIPRGWIKPEVRDSWQRCLNANLDPNILPEVPSISAGELKELRQRHAQLNEIASVEVHNLYSQIAGSNFMVAFATSDAVILETIAGSSMQRLARRTGIVPGSQWAEQLRGTNGLGCAAFTQQHLAIMPRNTFLRTAAD